MAIGVLSSNVRQANAASNLCCLLSALQTLLKIFSQHHPLRSIANAAMNEHLAERFGRSRRPEKTIGNSVDVLVLPQALNPRVREYFDPPKAAVQGGAWLQRPEVPSSAEVLDQDGLDTTGSSASSDVVLPVNKKRGPWASKGT